MSSSTLTKREQRRAERQAAEAAEAAHDRRRRRLWQLGAAAGLALALRVAPRLIQALRPSAPRVISFDAVASRPLERSWMGTSAARLRLTRGRAPPALA